MIAEWVLRIKWRKSLKNEYYDRKPLMMKVQNTITKFLGKTVLVCILAVGFGVPVLNMIRNALPITGIVILVVVIVLLIKFPATRPINELLFQMQQFKLAPILKTYILT